jgi:hypothetical protein
MKLDTILTNQNPDELRQIALSLMTQLDQQTRLRQQLEEALKQANRWRFGRKVEAFHGERR